MSSRGLRARFPFFAAACSAGACCPGVENKSPVEQAAAKNGKRARKPRDDIGVKRAAKYRGPNGEEWSGRGRTPKWLAVLEAEGRGREEFLIQG